MLMRFAQFILFCQCILLLWPLKLTAQSFADDFEEYSAGETAVWSDGAGVLVVDEQTTAHFGSPNHAVSLQEPSLRMIEEVREISAGRVSTFALDFVDLTDGPSKSGLSIGFGQGADLTQPAAALHIDLNDGEIIHGRIGGESYPTRTGVTSYEKGRTYRLFFVVNDTDDTLTRYEGMEDLAPNSYEVWLGPRDGAIRPVLEASIARTPNFVGFRSLIDTDVDIYADNMVVSRGVRLSNIFFEDGFEGYDEGERVSWDSDGPGALVVDQDTLEDFGRPNQSIHLSGSPISLFKDVSADTVGKVSTFNISFIEQPGSANDGVRIGFGQEKSLQSGQTAAVELHDGRIYEATTGNVTEDGLSGYSLNTPHQLYIVANDTEQALLDYYGGEDLPAGRFEVWLLSGAGSILRVLEATLPGNPNFIGLSTTGGDSGFYADNARITEGVRIEGGRSLAVLEPETPGVAIGVPFSLGYVVAAQLPAGSTYEITSDGDVSFPQGGATGPAASAGALTAVVNSGHRSNVTFTISIQNSVGTTLTRGSATVMAFDYGTDPDLPHPSVINTQGQLDAMRAVVRNEISSVARAGWDAMLATPYAALDYAHTPHETVYVIGGITGPSEDDFRHDAAAARSHALQWVVTGDPAHRDKALAILNDWGRTFRQIESETAPAQIHLESAWALPVWISAADIMRYYNGGAANWDPTDMAAFNYFMEVLYQHASEALYERNNWAVSAALAVMSYGAWSDEPEIFDTGLSFQLAKLDELSQSSGEIVETCRDTWHSQYSIVSWADAAELARNLGHDDLYEATFDGQSKPRLAIILEYFAKLMLGRSEAPCENWAYDYEGEYNRFDNYEVAYNHYLNRENASYLPTFKEMVEDHWREDVGEDPHFLLWSRLTHGASSIDPNYESPAGKGILLEYDVEDQRWINTGHWMGWVNDAFYPWLYVNSSGWFYASDFIAGAGGGNAGAWVFLPNDGATVPKAGSGPGTWAGAPKDQQGNINTGALLGWILVLADGHSWVYSWNLLRWVYLPETSVTSHGAWAYLPR